MIPKKENMAALIATWPPLTGPTTLAINSSNQLRGLLVMWPPELPSPTHEDPYRLSVRPEANGSHKHSTQLR
jgi:hypothetical protein